MWKGNKKVVSKSSHLVRPKRKVVRKVDGLSNGSASTMSPLGYAWGASIGSWTASEQQQRAALPGSSLNQRAFELNAARAEWPLPASNSGRARRGGPETPEYRRNEICWAVLSRMLLSPAHPINSNCGIDGMLRPPRLDIIFRQGPPDEETQRKHAWNPEDRYFEYTGPHFRSLNIFVRVDDNFTFHRHPEAQSTDCIRGKVGYSRGFHVWRLDWPVRQRGTHAVVGVGTEAAALQAEGYVDLIGTDDQSYGWNLTRNECKHDSEHTSPWKYPVYLGYQQGGSFVVPDKFYCVLDMDEGYMAFATDTEYLGVAFRNLKGKTLYPIVSTVWGHCEVTMKYLGGLDRESPSHPRRSARSSGPLLPPTQLTMSPWLPQNAPPPSGNQPAKRSVDEKPDELLIDVTIHDVDEHGLFGSPLEDVLPRSALNYKYPWPMVFDDD